jgi:hypothetical protein
MERKLRMSHAVSPHPEVRIKHDRIHKPIIPCRAQDARRWEISIGARSVARCIAASGLPDGA